MAAKWWRYNSTSHIFEQSLDEGTTWTIPPLNASIITEGTLLPSVIGGSVAFTDRGNIFNQAQFIQANGAVALYLNDMSAAVDSRKFRVINQASGLYFEAVNDAITVSQGYVFIGRTGTLTLTGAFNSGGTITSTSVVYPGRIDVAAQQASWYLGSHAAYGLYSNTGLYVAGNVWSGAAFIAPNATIRGFNIGVWADYAVAVWGDGGSVTNQGAESKYMIIANTMWLDIRMYATVNVASNWIFFNCPATATRICSGSGWMTGPSGNVPLHVESAVSSGNIQARRASNHPYDTTLIAAGAGYIFYVHIAIQINN